jgi:hypothetical protein
VVRIPIDREAMKILSSHRTQPRTVDSQVFSAGLVPGQAAGHGRAWPEDPLLAAPRGLARPAEEHPAAGNGLAVISSHMYPIHTYFICNCQNTSVISVGTS